MKGSEIIGSLGGVAIFGPKGKELTSWSWRASFDHQLGDVVWEDNDHLLATTDAGGAWSLLRLGLDGSVERAAGPVRIGPDYTPYLLPLR